MSQSWPQIDQGVSGAPDQQIALDDAVKYLQADQQAAQSFAAPVDPGEQIRSWISGERRDAHGRGMSSAAQIAFYADRAGDRSHHRQVAMLREVREDREEKYRVDWPTVLKVGVALGALAFLKWGCNRLFRNWN